MLMIPEWRRRMRSKGRARTDWTSPPSDVAVAVVIRRDLRQHLGRWPEDLEGGPAIADAFRDPRCRCRLPPDRWRRGWPRRRRVLQGRHRDPVRGQCRGWRRSCRWGRGRRRWRLRNLRRWLAVDDCEQHRQRRNHHHREDNRRGPAPGLSSAGETESTRRIVHLALIAGLFTHHLKESRRSDRKFRQNACGSRRRRESVAPPGLMTFLLPIPGAHAPG